MSQPGRSEENSVSVVGAQTRAIIITELECPVSELVLNRVQQRLDNAATCPRLREILITTMTDKFWDSFS